MEDRIMEKRQRYDNIDLLKSLAIFCVIIIHCYGVKIDFLEDRHLLDYAYYFGRTILAASVPIFFLCNGFLLFGKELNIKKHIIKTVKCFILTYLWGIITIFFTAGIKDVRLSVGEIINMFREWRLGWINHLWFMGALVRAYLIFPILKLASEKKRDVLVYMLIVLFIFITINKGLNMISLIEADNVWLKSVEIFDPFKDAYDWAYFYFGLGGILHSYQSDIREYYVKHKRLCNRGCYIIILLSCLLLFVCGVFISEMTKMYWDVVWEGYDMIFTMSMVLAIYILTLNYRINEKKTIARVINLISRNTLGIYFVHMLFLHMWNKSIAGAIGVSNIWTTIVCSICILGISLATTVLLKKMPFIKMLV